MASEIKIGSQVKLWINGCPDLIVEDITEVMTTTINGGTINRQQLTCVWFDRSTATFKRDKFYADIVYLVQ